MSGGEAGPGASGARAPRLATRVLTHATLVGIAMAGAVRAGQHTPAPVQDRSAWHWYKGNTHTHTLNSDGDSTPDDVVRWYREHGYHFLVLSDHNYLTSVDGLNALHGGDERFLVVPGEEVSDGFDGKPLHVNALNPSRLVDPPGGSSIVDVVQRMIDAIRGLQGVPHINHPNFRWAMTAEDLQRVTRYRLLEIFNGHPQVNNLGGGGTAGMEDIWDRLLTAGRRVYGIAVDDAHHFKRPWDSTASRPGRGWVMVHAPRLEAAALMASLEAGDFYASTGVELEAYEVREGELRVRVRQDGDSRYRIRVIGVDGRLLQEVGGIEARQSLAGLRGYVRATILESNGAVAWGQPLFLDER